MNLRIALLVREIRTGSIACGRLRSLEKWLGVYSYVEPAAKVAMSNETVLTLTTMMLTRYPTNPQLAVMLVWDILHIVEMYTASELKELQDTIKDMYEQKAFVIY